MLIAIFPQAEETKADFLSLGVLALIKHQYVDYLAKKNWIFCLCLIQVKLSLCIFSKEIQTPKSQLIGAFKQLEATLRPPENEMYQHSLI